MILWAYDIKQGRLRSSRFKEKKNFEPSRWLSIRLLPLAWNGGSAAKP